jgi:hypothetical protein
MNVLAEYPVLRTLSLGTRAHLSRTMAGWWAPPRRRGGARTVPGQAGVAARPVVRGAVQFLHPVWVDGRYNVAGVSAGDPAEQWRVNLGLLEAACAPAAAAPWTFTAVHHLPDGATRTAQVQVTDLLVPSRLAGVAAEVTLELLVPSGQFTYAAGL